MTAMRIAAVVRNDAAGLHHATVSTDHATQTLAIAPKAQAPGSSVNGGELLMLALATCYCNDVYREAARLNIAVQSVEIEAHADFTGIGLAATNIGYRARVVAPTASAAEIAGLLQQTDAVAEVHNTIRAGAPVTLLT